MKLANRVTNLFPDFSTWSRYEKWASCVKGILAQHLGFVLRVFLLGILAVFGRGEEGAFSGIGQVWSDGVEAHPGIPVPSVCYCHSFFMTEGTQGYSGSR